MCSHNPGIVIQNGGANRLPEIPALCPAVVWLVLRCCKIKCASKRFALFAKTTFLIPINTSSPPACGPRLQQTLRRSWKSSAQTTTTQNAPPTTTWCSLPSSAMSRSLEAVKTKVNSSTKCSNTLGQSIFRLSQTNSRLGPYRLRSSLIAPSSCPPEGRDGQCRIP